MKLSDYVIHYLSETAGIRDLFMVVGGANMHLVDSIAKISKIHYVCVQHEQSGSIAAEAYARVTGGLGFCLTTSGPGGTNALTGLACAWTDSIPVLFISGQVSRKDWTDGTTIRQLGVQQINIIPIVKSLCKYAAYIDDPLSIRYHLEKAVYLALEGRPGPVWLDIPQDVQLAQIEPDNLERFVSPKKLPFKSDWISRIGEILSLLESASRPVMIAGHGIRLSRAEKEFEALLKILRFPVITTWNGIDLMDHNDPLFIGRSGVFGQYGANFAVANSDLILSIGSRLDTRQTGTHRKSFARAAPKIVIDISAHELEKDLIDIDMPICADAKDFICELLPQLKNFKGKPLQEWIERCQKWKEKYPVTLPEYHDLKNRVNSYVFVNTLCEELTEKDIITTDMGTSLSCTMQSFKIKKGQRLFANTGFAPMGFGLPSAIGAWFASEKKRVICLSGDGGLQMNIQELQTVAHYKIPIKLFILNNKEYVTIKHTQQAYFDSRFVASDEASGYSTPDFCKVARAYGLPTETIVNQSELRDKIKEILSRHGPTVCEVFIPSGQPLIPILLQHRRTDGTIATDPIERLSPYLPEEEFKKNMIVKPLDD